VGVVLLGLSLPSAAEAQIISPGRLSSVHGGMEGMGNCTQCHQLRKAGADGARCLQCHQSLGRRIASQDGYHGRLEERDCGTCHKEHLGEDFSVIRMDPDTFSHASTGYTLKGSHQEAGCRTCHTPELVSDLELRQELAGTDGLSRTYMGLDQQCGSCHGPDDPHQDQFPDRDCSVCHTEVEWENPTEFDHDQSSFPLEGQHRELGCDGCHIVTQSREGTGSIRYVPVEATDCGSCHEDPHQDRMRGQCNRCHEASGWNRLDRSAVEVTFDHGITSFPLVSAHDGAECLVCHSRSRSTGGKIQLRFPAGITGRTYPLPEHETCNSCHLDSHEGVFGDRGCDVCHGQESWAPPDYDRAQHEMELRFELSGSHTVTPCSSCHESGAGNERRLVFRFEDPGSCAVCHMENDPHEGAFQTPGCELCHTTTNFGLNQFDHRLLEETGWVGRCGTCHEADDPHVGQFQGRDCRACHGTDSYEILDFDHATTRYPLEGAHAEVPCGACHLVVDRPAGEEMTRYRPIDSACTACHGGGE